MFLRMLSLTIGPFFLVGASYWVAYSDPLRPADEAVTESAPESSTTADEQERSLRGPWRQEYQRLKGELPAGMEVVVTPPYLLATDLPKGTRKKIEHDVLQPVYLALQKMFEVREPHRPIVVVVCAGEDQFRDLARHWRRPVSPGYHGFYLRDRRLVALHWEAGTGALAHELTHALTHADAPKLPEWFDEGLASLYEEAEFDLPGRPLGGLDNWRITQAATALREDRLPNLADLTEPGAFGEGDLALNYATARCWALYLQEQKLLPRYYMALRSREGTDATGLDSLAAVMRGLPQRTIERRFQSWLSQRRPRITTGRSASLTRPQY